MPRNTKLNFSLYSEVIPALMSLLTLTKHTHIFNVDVRSEKMLNAVDSFPFYTGSNKHLSAIATQWKDMVKYIYKFSICTNIRNFEECFE